MSYARRKRKKGLAREAREKQKPKPISTKAPLESKEIAQNSKVSLGIRLGLICVGAFIVAVGAISLIGTQTGSKRDFEKSKKDKTMEVFVPGEGVYEINVGALQKLDLVITNSKEDREKEHFITTSSEGGGIMESIPLPFWESRSRALEKEERKGEKPQKKKAPKWPEQLFWALPVDRKEGKKSDGETNDEKEEKVTGSV